MKLQLIFRKRARELWYQSDDDSIVHELQMTEQAKLTAQQIYEWGSELCDNYSHREIATDTIRRRSCPSCWRELKEATNGK